jgi:hypothetical protein
MSDKNLLRALRAAFTSEIDTTPVHHPLWTKECPSIPEFAPDEQARWDDGRHQHVAGCPYCRMTLAAVWREQCPGPDVLAAYKAGLYYQKEILEIHLRECGRGCADALKNSAIIEHMARRKFLDDVPSLLRAGKGVAPGLAHALLGGAHALLGGVAILGKQLDLAAAAADTDRPRGRLHERVVSPDGSLVATLVETDVEDALMLRIKSTKRLDAAKAVRVQILFSGREPLEATVVLDAGEASLKDYLFKGIMAELRQMARGRVACRVEVAWADADFWER